MSTRRKAKTRALLAARDLCGLTESAEATPGALRDLLSLTFDADELIRWRAVEAIGHVAAVLAETDLEKVRAFIRRLLWSMNHESGGVGWHAPETIGEILANVPALIPEFGVLLTAFCREAPFERGTHLAVCRVACVDRTPFVEGAAELVDSLDTDDAFIRGYAALALGAIGAASHRAAIEALRDDDTPLTSYDVDTGQLERTTVGQMASRACELLDARTDA